MALPNSTGNTEAAKAEAAKAEAAKAEAAKAEAAKAEAAKAEAAKAEAAKTKQYAAGLYRATDAVIHQLAHATDPKLVFTKANLTAVVTSNDPWVKAQVNAGLLERVGDLPG
jgi:hypothetical protein